MLEGVLLGICTSTSHLLKIFVRNPYPSLPKTNITGLLGSKDFTVECTLVNVLSVTLFEDEDVDVLVDCINSYRDMGVGANASWV